MNDNGNRDTVAPAIRSAAYGLCAVAFAVVGLAGLIIGGDATVQRLAVAAALLGCFGQFIGQASVRPAQIASVVCSYGAFALALWGLALL